MDQLDLTTGRDLGLQLPAEDVNPGPGGVEGEDEPGEDLELDGEEDICDTDQEAEQDNDSAHFYQHLLAEILKMDLYSSLIFLSTDI